MYGTAPLERRPALSPYLTHHELECVVISSIILDNGGCAQENERRELLQMSDPQLADVARVCNRYPDIEVNFDVVGGETVTAGEAVQINVFMERTLLEGQELASVHCPRCVCLASSPCRNCLCAMPVSAFCTHWMCLLSLHICIL